MKNRIKYLFFAIPALLLAGCFEDKGNYDYTTINEVWVDTAGVQTSFTLGQYETLSIAPNVKFSSGTGDETGLSYRWVLYAAEGDTFMEELSTEQNLAAIVNRPPGNYRVSLYITDRGREPNLTSMMNYTVNVIKNIVSGIVVMHTDQEGTDVDYIATPNTVPIMEETRHLADLYSTVNGRKITGNPLSLSTLGAYSNFNAAQRFDRIVIGTDTESVLLNGEDFSERRNAASLFLNTPERIGTWSASNKYQVSVLVNDEQAYFVQSYWILEMSGPIRAGSTLSEPLALAPFTFVPEQMASSTRSFAILYDKSGQRFVNMEYTTYPEPVFVPFTAQSSQLFDVNNIGMEVLYMGKGFGGDGFAVFADGSDRWLYRMNFNYRNPETGSYNLLEVTDLAKGKYNLTNAPEIAGAKFYANGLNGDVFLYATDRNIYTYQYAGSQTATRINNDFAGGETITAMHLVTYRVIPSNWGSYDEVSGNILYVGTWDGTQGKLYEFRINRTSGRLENGGEPLNTFTGFGRISGIALKEEADAIR